uniref:hypothetical protein n=1 Tax=uncultured Flavonifractor sp. TaxID=1193534 RepID=UPI002615EB3B|nr:hypothetical protein [uncultured Flavonifractor sp.]
MKEKSNRLLSKMTQWLSIAGRILCLYLDDLFLLAGGVCFVRAAFDLGGRPAALATAGICLTAYAVVVARSRGGGRK